MADKSKIQWTGATWNIVNGCSILSAGCTNCYAMKLAGTRLRNHPSRAGLTQPSKAGVAFFGKQNVGGGPLPEDLRIEQYPEVA